MDDLSGLSWSAPSNTPPKPTSTPVATTSSSFYPPLRPTPSPLASGRNTPLSTQPSAPAIAFKAPPAKPAQDSFSNLVNFGAAKSTANLSLKERQERLEAERRKKEDEKRKQAQAQYGDGRFFDSLGGSRSGTPRTSSPALAPPTSTVVGAQNGKPAESDDDLFAAFNASTKVDKASHFPPPEASSRPSPAPVPAVGPPSVLDLSNPQAWGKSMVSGAGGLIDDDDDDDPFGLNQLKAKPNAPPAPPADEDDDFLGDLGKPVGQVAKKAQAQPQPPSFSRTPEPGKAIEDSSSDSEPESVPTSNDPFDKAVAQLVDYGFTPENARRGLTESGAGLNVQAAVNWLLDDAHRQAREKAKSGKQGGREHIGDNGERASSQSRSNTPSWMREGEGSRSRDNRSPASLEADFTKTAAAVGSSLLKSANSLWKQGQKKVQKAVSEFQQDGDPNQPKWMRSAQQERGGEEKRRIDVTDEAMLLESGGRPGRKPGLVDSRSSSNTASRDHSPAVSGPKQQSSAAPRWQQASQTSALDPRSRLSKHAVEEQSSLAYVSPARRKKTPQLQPETRPPPEAEPDLLFHPTPIPKAQSTFPPRPAQSVSASRSAPRQPPAPRPAAAPRPQRHVPSVSAIALQNSAKHRIEGTAHFKRGDYAAAHASYTSSLTSIPQTHPLAILLLCNRSLTALKTGEPRQAVDDADAAINLIGPGKGEGEQVDLCGGDNEKRDMHELYGKALTRKAEALEQMEKWSEAATVWQLCVESGHGGPLAIAGRQRCQKALAPKPAAPPPRAAPSRPRPPPAATNQKSSEAVERLRAVNRAAENEGREKFELTDKVDARISAWRDGKRDNLRALLSSMENVLWEGSEWKKVGLHELVMANKVKIIYMKAIAKTHPDKIAQDASTEVRMISGTVFSTLNEAWDKFKVENGL